jgi:hypothetical protein
MPRTLENHLTGVLANEPHPESYRPDLPLLTSGRSVFAAEQYDKGYDDGFSRGKQRGREIGYDSGYAAGDRDATARLQHQQERPGA